MKIHSKKIISYILTIAVIAAALAWVCVKFIHLGNVEFTDNAQVARQIVPVNSRVQGYIKEIRFKEYGQVRKGDTLVIIDDADIRTPSPDEASPTAPSPPPQPTWRFPTHR